MAVKKTKKDEKQQSIRQANRKKTGKAKSQSKVFKKKTTNPKPANSIKKKKPTVHLKKQQKLTSVNKRKTQSKTKPNYPKKVPKGISSTKKNLVKTVSVSRNVRVVKAPAIILKAPAKKVAVKVIPPTKKTPKKEDKSREIVKPIPKIKTPPPRTKILPKQPTSSVVAAKNQKNKEVAVKTSKLKNGSKLETRKTSRAQKNVPITLSSHLKKQTITKSKPTEVNKQNTKEKTFTKMKDKTPVKRKMDSSPTKSPSKNTPKDSLAKSVKSSASTTRGSTKNQTLSGTKHSKVVDSRQVKKEQAKIEHTKKVISKIKQKVKPDSKGKSIDTSPTLRPSRKILKPARYLDTEPEEKKSAKSPERKKVTLQPQEAKKRKNSISKGNSTDSESETPTPKKKKETKDCKPKPQQDTAKMVEAPKGKTRGTPMVFNVPKGKDIQDAIKHAIEAATVAGVVDQGKHIVVKGPSVKDTKLLIKPTLPTKGNKTTTKAASPQKYKQGSMASEKETSIERVQTNRTNARVAVVNPEPKKPVVHAPSLKTMLTNNKDPYCNVFTCLDCGNCFSSRKEVSDHKHVCEAVGKTRVNACMDCGKVFQTRAELNVHRKENHNSTRTSKKSSSVTMRGYKCSVCDIFFPDSQELKFHILEIHKGIAEGVMCNVVTTPDPKASVNWNGPISEKMVEDVIQNLVDGVSKSKRSGAVEEPSVSRQLSSSGEIGAKEMTNFMEEATISSVETSPPSSPYQDVRRPGQCLDCFMKVNSRLELAQHKRVCSMAIKNKQMFCYDCGKSFKSYKELSSHKLEEHALQDLNLKCPPCNISYKSYAGLMEHNRAVHGWQPETRVQTTQPNQSEPEKEHDKAPGMKRRVANEEEHIQDKNTKKRNIEKTETREKQTVQSPRRSRAPILKVPESPNAPSRELLNTSPAIGTIQFLSPDTSPPRSPPATGKIAGKKKKGIATKKSTQPSPPSLQPSATQPDDRTSISLANGLVTISADKANDYQIFVDAKPDGSSIQVKLVKNENQQKDKPDPEKGKQEKQICETSVPVVDETNKALQETSVPVHETSKRSLSLIRRGERLRQMKFEQAVAQKAAANAAPMIIPSHSEELRGSKNQKSTSSKAEINESQPNVEKEESVLSKNSKAANIVNKGTIRVSVPKEKSASNKSQVEKVQPQTNQPQKSQNKTSAAGTNPAGTQNAQNTNEKGKDKDVGKVVQKGKPFVIGGQTMVPIQFPPDFQLPGGNSGGQKVFAIPATNLPAGLLQLMGKQNKGNVTASQKPATSNKANIAVKETSKPAGGKKKPEHLNGVPQEGTTKFTEPSVITTQIRTSPLKGMTGAQLMARAQAKILGRPIASQSAGNKTIKSGKPTLAEATIKIRVPPNSQQGRELAKSNAKQSQPKKPSVRQAGYQDPLYVYQCTYCEQTFKCTGDIKLHVTDGLCPGVKPERNLRPKRNVRQPEKTEAGEWHIKPVEPDAADPEDVEWFVASNEQK